MAGKVWPCAHLDLHGGAVLHVGREEGEGDAVAQGGAEVPARGLPDRPPSTSTRLLAAGWAAALGGDAAQLAGDAALLLGRQGVTARGSRPCPTARPNPRPAWSGVIPGPELVAVERQAGFEPQRVAGPEPGRLDPGAEHRVPQRRRVPGRHGDLHAVLAGVAGAGDHDADAVPAQATRRGTADLGRPGSTVASRSRAAGPWTARMARVPVTSASSPTPRASRTRAGVRRVRHDVEAVVVDPPHDDVVEHGCVVGIEEVGVLRPPRPDPVRGRW